MRIALENVSFAYGDTPAVREVSIEIARPEIVTLIGPNGSGKSTLLKLLARIVRPAVGRVVLDGRAADDWAPREYAKRVGYLAQQLEVAFPMRAIDVVLSGRAPYLSRFRWEGVGDVAAAEEALAACDAIHLRDRGLDEMSGGEKKRVFLARVLAADPQLVLLDEPLAALDASHARGLALLMGRLTSRGRNVVFVAHDFHWAAAVSDRVVVMSHGEIVADGPPREVLTPSLFRDVFSIDVEVVEGSGGVGWVVPSFRRG